MKTVVILLVFFSFVYTNKLSIGFSSINPARDISARIKEVNDGIVKERYLNIKVSNLRFKNMSSNARSDVSEDLDDFSESLYDSLNRAGPSLATKEQKEVRFSDVQYKGIALTSKNIKKLWVFHEDRKKYGIKFLSELSKQQKLDIIIYQKVAQKKWKIFGENMQKEKGKIKPTIAVFNNFSKAQTYTYPTILASYIQNEEYEKMNEIIESKSIEALKKAFSVGVANSSIDDEIKVDKKNNTKKSKKKKLAVSDISDMGGTGAF